MTKKTSKPKSDVKQLRYNGVVVEGQNADRYITSPVLVPSRDLGLKDLIELAMQWTVVSGEPKTEKDVVAWLTSGAPGLKASDGRPLYEADASYQCEECGETFKDWRAWNKHELEAHAAPEPKGAD